MAEFDAEERDGRRHTKILDGKRSRLVQAEPGGDIRDQRDVDAGNRERTEKNSEKRRTRQLERRGAIRRQPFQHPPRMEKPVARTERRFARPGRVRQQRLVAEGQQPTRHQSGVEQGKPEVVAKPSKVRDARFGIADGDLPFAHRDAAAGEAHQRLDLEIVPAASARPQRLDEAERIRPEAGLRVAQVQPRLQPHPEIGERPSETRRTRHFGTEGTYTDPKRGIGLPAHRLCETGEFGGRVLPVGVQRHRPLEPLGGEGVKRREQRRALTSIFRMTQQPDFPLLRRRCRRCQRDGRDGTVVHHHDKRDVAGRLFDDGGKRRRVVVDGDHGGEAGTVGVERRLHAITLVAQQKKRVERFGLRHRVQLVQSERFRAQIKKRALEFQPDRRLGSGAARQGVAEKQPAAHHAPAFRVIAEIGGVRGIRAVAPVQHDGAPGTVEGDTGRQRLESLPCRRETAFRERVELIPLLRRCHDGSRQGGRTGDGGSGKEAEHGLRLPGVSGGTTCPRTTSG